ncbi:hypothetical protein HK101_001530, partial [Irineochytrium annulatum]
MDPLASSTAVALATATVTSMIASLTDLPLAPASAADVTSTMTLGPVATGLPAKPPPPLSLQQLNTIQVVTRVSSGLAACGALSVIYLILRDRKELSKAATRLVLAIALTDLVDAVKSGISRLGPESGASSAICQIQAMLVTYSGIMDALLTLFMSLIILYLVFFQGLVDRIRKWEWAWILGAFVCTVAISVVPSFTSPRLYGVTAIWCWIEPSHTFWQLALGWPFTWTTMIFNILAYFLTAHRMKLLAREFQHAESGTGASSSGGNSGNAYMGRTSSSATGLTANAYVVNHPVRATSMDSNPGSGWTAPEGWGVKSGDMDLKDADASWRSNGGYG